MRKTLRAVFAGVLFVGGAAGAAFGHASLASRVTAQDALFEEIYQAQLKNSPEGATSIGDYRYNDQLDDNSLAGIAREHAADMDYLTRLRAIPTGGMQ
jgi:hypothetical protein